MDRDHRPFLALAALLAILVVLFAVPASRAVLMERVVEPVQVQADPAPGLNSGYSAFSLAFWALVGAVFAWAAYELVFVRLGIAPDGRFFAALAPVLVFGPLYHAILVAGGIPRGTAWAYLGAEPLVYLTSAVVALAVLAVLRATGSLPAAVGVGVLALAPLAVLVAPFLGVEGLWQATVLVVMALASAAVLAFLFVRLRPEQSAWAAFAVIGAHALDGATTWMVLRDPLGLGFEGFSERNPLSETLVELSNGWPYFAIKLALPVALLWAIRAEEGEEGMHAFLMFAVFILGYGPGMSNLLQVVLG